MCTWCKIFIIYIMCILPCLNLSDNYYDIQIKQAKNLWCVFLFHLEHVGGSLVECQSLVQECVGSVVFLSAPLCCSTFILVRATTSRPKATILISLQSLFYCLVHCWGTTCPITWGRVTSPVQDIFRHFNWRVCSDKFCNK